ncbi:hypothetical protein QFC19_006620 [Naganishia cerealis]|uniref:Uncharacterized protein n=1 Tax=Naganishia cerealis TaxID=610337 RepID=A0ACC2VFX0_9TREE|nr:hypothetical protein QFC19_006620 [Naganishia cerealis]
MYHPEKLTSYSHSCPSASQRDNAKHKERSDTLAAQLAALEGASGNEAGSRTRVATSGRNTPTIDLETSRKYQKLVQQYSELTRKHDVLQEELAALREVCTGREREVEVTRRRATEAEEEIALLRDDLDRLESCMIRDGRTVDEVELENKDLRLENDSLKSENDSLNHKIGLLLDVDDSSHHGHHSLGEKQSAIHNDGVEGSYKRRSLSVAGSEEHNRALESLTAEMEEWQRRYAPVTPTTEASPPLQANKINGQLGKSSNHQE